MNEAYCSILYENEERWICDPDLGYIIFRENNTGTVCILFDVIYIITNF